MELIKELIGRLIPDNPAELGIIIGVALFAITIHEYSHGKAALSLGDPTAKNAGRLTLNPFPHIAPLGALFMLFFHFGWARPVPVNPAYFKDRKKGMILMALSGPISNFAAAFTAGLFVRHMYLDNDIYRTILIYMVLLNTGFGLFNLIPIPPFDGSHVIENLLPDSAAVKFMKTRRYAPVLLIALFLLDRFTNFNIFGRIFSLPMIQISGLFGGPNFFKAIGM